MAHLAPLSGDDPLSGLSMLTSLYEHEHTSERVRVSIFCDLLLLGDGRVLPLLDRLWGLLERQGRRDVLFAKCQVGSSCAPRWWRGNGRRTNPLCKAASV